MRHFTEISTTYRMETRHRPLCFIFDALRFQAPDANGGRSEEMKEAVRRRPAKGGELADQSQMDPAGVGLLDYFKLDLFDGMVR